jgi:2-hydroxychromene-2-carboxylate isomerase
VTLKVTQARGKGTAVPATDREPSRTHPVFYFSFDSPESYLAAERVLQVIEGPCEWIPIRAPQDPWVFRCAEERTIAEQEIERIAAERELQPMRWPPDFDPEQVLRAATFAKSIGRTVSFTLAAFRQAYAGGADLSDQDVILIAAAGCEMHPRAVIGALERDAITRALDDATAEALARGVTQVPTVWLPDGKLLEGDAALDKAPTP